MKIGRNLFGVFGKVVLFVALASMRSVVADTIIIPASYSNNDAPAYDNAPLGAVEQRIQQVYSASLLSSLQVGSVITGIGLRVQSYESSLPAQTVSTYDIGMSMAGLPAGSLSPTLAANRGADYQLVRSGPLTIDANMFPGGASPNGFGWITFSTPYQYQGGDLLIELAFQGFAMGRDVNAAYPVQHGSAQTAFGNGYSATTADAGIYDEAIIMALDVTPPVMGIVPEPSSMGLFALGAFFLVRRVRK